MRRSGFWFRDLSFVSSRLAGLTHKFLNRSRVTPRPFDVFRNSRIANFAGRYDRTVGVRSFGKLYGVRGLRPTLSALHRDWVKFHMDTTNIRWMEGLGAAEPVAKPFDRGLILRPD